MVFNKNGDVGTLTFAGPIDLTNQNTITALQSLSTNVITGGNNGSGTSVLGIRSDNLAAFDTACTISAVVPTASQPGLVVYDNTGAVVGYVANNQFTSTIVGGDTLDNFTWTAGTKTLSWTTTGFSSFGTDNTGPTVTDGKISIAGDSGTGGVYIIGDTVTVTWDAGTEAGGNADLASATVDFTGFGGGSAVAMTDTTACGGTTTAGDDVYEACYTLVGGTIEATSVNASVTATDNVGNTTTTADTTNATVDNQVPTLTTVTIASDNADSTLATTGDAVTITMVASETITQPVATFASGGVAVANPTVYFPAWRAIYTADAADTDGVVSYTINFSDTAGNAGTQVTTTTNSSSVTFDISDPTVSTYSPADDATDVAINSNLILTFGENVVVGTGNVVLYNAAGDVVVETIPITDTKVTFDGSTKVTIDPTANLVNSTNYYLKVDSTAIEDGVGNAYAGIADKTTWSFTTVAVTPAPTTPTTTTGGGGGGGGGGSITTSSTSNTSTSKLASKISTVIGNQTYSRPVQLNADTFTVDQDAQTKTALLTDKGTLTIKPNSKATTSLFIPEKTKVEGSLDWDGKILPPLIKSKTMINSKGEEIEGSKKKLEQKNVVNIVKIGSLASPLKFSNKVTLEIPLDLKDGTVVKIYQSQGGDIWGDMGTGIVKNGKLIFETDHLSYFALESTEAIQAVSTLGTSKSFADTVGHWAEAYIQQIAELGIASGKSETSFAPNDAITRAELTKMAVKAFEISVDPQITSQPFGDVLTGAWYAPYVAAAKKNSVVNGYSDGSFKPNATVNRAEALKILLAAAGFDVEEAITESFPDTIADAWYMKYVNYAAKNGIVGGYSNGNFGPSNNITRAEVSKVIIKILDMQ